jgi:hypothetical protein
MADAQTTIPKICMRGYECWHCSFDQWLDEMEIARKVEMRNEAKMIVLARAA